MHIYLLIILFLLARHQDKDQWDLFHVVLASSIRIDGPELGEKVAAQLEGTIYKLGLGFAEELKLFFCGKDKMASTVDSHICLKETASTVSRRTYKNEEGTKFYKRMWNQIHLNGGCQLLEGLFREKNKILPWIWRFCRELGGLENFPGNTKNLMLSTCK